MIYTRPTTDSTLMAMAAVLSERSTCHRYIPESHIGAIIAREGRIISTGYNGAPAGLPHCEHHLSFEHDDKLSRPVVPDLSELLRRPGARGCTVAIHAEANALAYAARHGTAVDQGTLYVTLSPCEACAQLVIAAGLIRVVYGRPYRNRAGVELLKSAGLKVECLV